MNRELSVYFDLLRFIACLAVLLYHSNMRNIITEPIALSNYGHSAVIVFFVLSGYVISFVTDKKENTLLAYSASRFARIYSVALPALVITPFLDIIGEYFNSIFYIEKTTHDFWYIRIISGLFFLNEIWFISIMEFSNVPYWSLCYEAWYYILYGTFVFTSGRKRILLISAILLIIGPKILLLFPTWALGVFIYKKKSLRDIPEKWGWILFIGSFVIFTMFNIFEVAEYFNEMTKTTVGDEWYKLLTFSKFFIGDYILALIISMNFLGFRTISHRCKRLFKILENSSRKIANHTFALYLLHQPLILFFAAVLSGNPENSIFYIKTMLCVAASVYLLAKVTENKKSTYKLIFLKIAKHHDKSIHNN